VLEVLLGRVPPAKPSETHGWRVIPLPGLVYPGLVRGRATVTGLTIDDLTDDDWAVIDAFENPEYDLSLVQLTDARAAWAYICSDTTEPADGAWDTSTFAQHHLRDYVHRCADWRARYSATLQKAATTREAEA
jgi:Gamma-glutamyl cyclotransferase, AIG2-like